MPGCVAVGCNNRSEKGYIMKCFPRDPKLRKIWQDKVARADWEPSNNSFLCHVHFEPQEWSITPNGRIRLKKNAIPSIFTITSTRKSPKKRTKIIEIKGNGLQKSIEEEELEEEEEFSYPNEESFGSRESVVMIAKDKLTDISRLVRQNNLEVQITDNNRKELELLLMINNSNNMSTIVKEEMKVEKMDHDTLEDSYDEIEEKLKQICDGGSTEDDNRKNNKKEKQQTKNYRETECEEDINCVNNEERKVTLSNHNPSMRSDKEENVEIIFGTESGDEKKVLKADDNPMEYDKLICIKDEKKIFNEDIEENFTKDEVHVIPNIRAAMKRKRRTREEIMKSIKRSINSTTDQDANSSSSSDSSETEIGNELPMSSPEMSDINKSNDLEVDTTKFIIKVTGDPDDVTEIMEELSSNTFGSRASSNFESVYKKDENDAFVTSVITVMSPKNPKNVLFSDLNSSLEKDVIIIDNSLCEDGEIAGPIRNSQKSVPSYSKDACSDEENKPPARPPLQTRSHSVQTNPEDTEFSVPPDYEDLLERMRIQEDVISKLTDQVIIYKEMENSLRNKNSGREATKDAETVSRINTRSSNALQSSALNKKNLECKQRLIEDLSNRVNYFEEMNKKLMKTVTLESQQKRKLEGQIKQKDSRIKELNWKLEKASKYLERAEKNTNTYRRKMLNMQTIMRRRKLLDEKMSKFNDMLDDISRQEFSDTVLSMAADIRKTCGRSGYDKLISYGFPLPPLPALRKTVFSEERAGNKEDTDKGRNSTHISIKTEKDLDTNNESELDEKDSELADSVTKTTEYDGAETVTGTVQDIFDENNDGDDFSTNELREHFILQLNAVM